MGLGLAGAISGAGNAMTQGLQTLNSGIVQMGVQQSLQAGDREFQMKKLEMQQNFERGLMREKMTADKENTAAQIEAQGKVQKELEGMRGDRMEKIEGMRETSANLRLDKELGVRYDLGLKQMDMTKDIHDKDRAMLEKRYDKMYSLEERKLALTKGQVHTLATGDGRIALFTPDGKGHGYLKDDKGNEIKAPADLPKTAQIEINSLVDEMHDMSREYAKQPMHTPEQEDAYKVAKNNIRTRIADVLSEYTGGKKTGTPSPNPNKIVIPEKYKNIGQGTVLAPTSSSTPTVPPKEAPGVTKAPGMMGAVKGVVPGLGMIENFLRK
jgi:hypothetical protein